MEAPTFVLETRHDGSVRIAGEADMSRVDAIERAIGPLVDAGGSVTVDLSELTFCDSSCIRTLFHLHRRATEQGAELQLVGALAPIRKVFTVAGLEDLLS